MCACHATSDTSSASTFLPKKVLASAVAEESPSMSLVKAVSRLACHSGGYRDHPCRSLVTLRPVNTAPCSPAGGWGWYVCFMCVWKCLWLLESWEQGRRAQRMRGGGILPDGTTKLMRYWDRGKLVLIFVAIDRWSL